VAPDELALACRLTGLSLDDLWLRYLELGGSLSKGRLAARIAGAAWPGPEDCYLAVVADEALQECGLPRLAPPVVHGAPGRAAVPDDDGAADRSRTAAVVLEARTRGVRLTALFEQCDRTRAAARGVREHAASVRRAGRAGRSLSRGGG
jgi:hypothetical protein